MVYAAILSAAIGVVSGRHVGVPVAISLAPSPSHALSDDIDVSVHFRNTSDSSWYLVWYGFKACAVEPESNTLRYVEDMDRDPALSSCGGAYAFHAPSFFKLMPGEELRRDITLWTYPMTQPPGRFVDTPASELAAIPVLVPGEWKLVARFAFLAEAALPKGLDGVHLCEHLRSSELLVESSATVVVDTDAGGAWAARRARIEATCDQWESEGYFCRRYIEFFERLTGVPSGMERDGFRLARNPPVVHRALVAWDEWFERRGGRLVWDNDGRRFVVRDEVRPTRSPR